MDTRAGTGEAESCRSAVVRVNSESDCKGRNEQAGISLSPQALLSSTGAVAEEAALLVWGTQTHPWGALALGGSVLVRRHRARTGYQPLWFLMTSPGALQVRAPPCWHCHGNLNKWGRCFLGPTFTCAFVLKTMCSFWAGKGVLLDLDLVSESCSGEKHSLSGRIGGSSGLPKRVTSSLVWEGQPALGAG